ncbi:MAG: sigma-70 family RNA polymerase sigma factor [Rhodothermia bacterium]
MTARTDITGLVVDLRSGNPGAVDYLFPLVYDELRRIAHFHLSGERPNHTLSTTALVHEAYLKLVDQSRAGWQDRAHFCAVASKAMRRILIDYARRRNALKRGGSDRPVSIDDNKIAIEEKAAVLLSLDEALDRLSALDERCAKIVEFRFFGGLREEEIAEVINVSVRTVRRDWVKARAWLYKEMKSDE